MDIVDIIMAFMLIWTLVGGVFFVIILFAREHLGYSRPIASLPYEKQLILLTVASPVICVVIAIILSFEKFALWFINDRS